MARQSTLLDLIQAVSAFATSEDEVVATVTYLINSGKVRLCGTFAGARVDLGVRRPVNQAVVRGRQPSA